MKLLRVTLVRKYFYTFHVEVEDDLKEVITYLNKLGYADLNVVINHAGMPDAIDLVDGRSLETGEPTIAVRILEVADSEAVCDSREGDDGNVFRRALKADGTYSLELIAIGREKEAGVKEEL